MKILIYGSKGWIGGLFKSYLFELNNLDLEVVDGISRVDSDDLLNELLEVKPTHVISFIGRTHGKIDSIPEPININTIDYLEYPGKLVENIRDNLFSPIVLADLCFQNNIHYTYLGTGCIFNSDELNKSFTELNYPNYFGSSYSIVKGFTDRLMKSRKILNLRIRMPISSVPNSRNFITKIVNYSKICSIPNSMTVLDDFFPIFFDLMKNKTTGTFNCTNPGTITHNEILLKYRDLIDSNITWENITISEQAKLLKSDRSNNELDTSKIQELYPELKSIDESIELILLIMKKNIAN